MILKKLNFIITIFIIFVLGIEVFADASDDVLGIWFNQEKMQKLRFTKKNNKYHGKNCMVERTHTQRKTKGDVDNPEPESVNDLSWDWL
jgi:hypothetical protein